MASKVSKLNEVNIKLYHQPADATIGKHETHISEPNNNDDNDTIITSQFTFHGLINPNLVGMYECEAVSPVGNASTYFYVGQYFNWNINL
jgi:hypothetical protein